MTYEFVCEKCGETVEVVCPMSERNTPRKHSKCGGKLVRVYSPLPHKWVDCEWPGGWANKGKTKDPH